jgi:cytoskeletal protein CcmA (bactofilin family)
MTQKEIETPAAAESPNKPAASQAAPAAKTNGRKPATIGPSIVIHGDVSGEEDLIVDGTVEGTVNFKDNNLVVSANGQVKANISARIIRIDGEVKGELHGSEQVVISPTGKVHGDIRAPRVVLEDGCTFRGSVEMETEKSPAVDRAATPRLRPTAARPVRPGRES